MRLKAIFGLLLCALLLGSMLGAAAPAQADREMLENEKGSIEWLDTSEAEDKPPPKGQIEGACGLTVAPSGNLLYVSDYHHHVVDAFNDSGIYVSQIAAVTPPGAPPAIPPEGPCGLAVDAAGNLYANYWHERVVRLQPSVQMLDADESTGVAVDLAATGASDVYVNDRTYVAVYEPSGAPVLDEGVPLRIGLGSLGDAYGLAVFGERVYVADAATNSVKVFELTDPLNPVLTIAGPGGLSEPFNSLVDAGLAVDPTNGHLLVADNRKPGFEEPLAAIYEFAADGTYLGQLPGAPVQGDPSRPGPVHGEPSGLGVDPTSGNLYVTTGNGERSNAFAYGPYTASLTALPPGSAPGSVGEEGSVAAVQSASSSRAPSGPAAVASEVIQRRGVRVSFDGKLTPRSLPRRGAAPVGIAVDAKIAATSGDDPPQLRRIEIEINRHGHFTPQGLSLCRLRDIQPSTTANALAACRDSLVGEGHFSADVKLPEQSPFPSEGKVLAFNGRLEGKPAILAHIFGTEPIPTSYVLPFLINDSRGTYGTILEASLPQATGNWGYVTGLQMTLRRRFSSRGQRRSYLSAGCPAPAGFPSVVFPLARTSFAFAGGMTLVSILNRTCKARG